jgi:hypothetical protein
MKRLLKKVDWVSVGIYVMALYVASVIVFFQWSIKWSNNI